jgi:NAD(P)-dependent dehydrogenase (short-subunit alcohol dehydrogenase family)
MQDFSGQTVLVTGGAGHIGRAICEHFLKAGANVVACGRREPADPIAIDGRAAKFICADVRDSAATERLVATVTEQFGGLDILVNNAGGGPPVESASASPSLTEKIVALNLVAPLVLAQQAHAALAQGARSGVVINVASVSGVRPSPGSAAYGAAKAGLVSATQSLAMEWGPDIRVNAIVVGLVHNDAGHEHYGGEAGFKKVADMLPLKRMAEPADIARSVLMLCSDDAAYISGASLEVHGGGEVPVFLHLANEARSK